MVGTRKLRFYESSLEYLSYIATKYVENKIIMWSIDQIHFIFEFFFIHIPTTSPQIHRRISQQQFTTGY